MPAAPLQFTQDVLDDPARRGDGLPQRVPFPGAPAGADHRDAVPAVGHARHDPPRAPLLGEHTDEILGEIGYAAAEIAGLKARHVV